MKASLLICFAFLVCLTLSADVPSTETSVTSKEEEEPDIESDTDEPFNSDTTVILSTATISITKTIDLENRTSNKHLDNSSTRQNSNLLFLFTIFVYLFKLN